MNPTNQFTVDTAVVPLAVTVEHGVVTRINLNLRAQRPPETPFEQRVAGELEEYFAGTRTRFTFPIGPEGTEFDRRVWRAVQQIPYGETTTYGEIAHRIGKPLAARAVGTANGRNPLPIVIPCHRVVAAGGRLGGYGGGLALKQRLLNLETAHRPHSRARLGGTLLLWFTLLVAAACGDIERPVFGAGGLEPDTTPPTITFLAPGSADTIFVPGRIVMVRVRVTDQSPLSAVAASVTGVITLAFPTILPSDTSVTAQFPIPTTNATSGTITFTIEAVDQPGNSATGMRSFLIR